MSVRDKLITFCKLMLTWPLYEVTRDCDNSKAGTYLILQQDKVQTGSPWASWRSYAYQILYDCINQELGHDFYYTYQLQAKSPPFVTSTRAHLTECRVVGMCKVNEKDVKFCLGHTCT